MANRPWQLAFIILIALAIITVGLGWSKLTGEPEPDPFHMTLLVSSVDANATDANQSDVVLWVAVVGGEPRPRWSKLEVTLGAMDGDAVLEPPQLMVDDQDGNGRISQGDLIHIRALEDHQLEGEGSIDKDGISIVKVKLKHATPSDNRDESGHDHR